MNTYKIVYQDELNHHGVKGMKWGVRKEPYASSSGAGKKVQNAIKLQKASDNAYSQIGKSRRQLRLAKKSKNQSSISKAKANLKTAKKNFETADAKRHAASEKAKDYTRYKNPKDFGKQILAANKSQFDFYRTVYSDVKKAKGKRAKAEAAIDSYMNTPYRIVGYTGTYNTTVARNFSGRW